MVLRHRLAAVAGLVLGLSLLTGPLVAAQDGSPPTSPLPSPSPVPSLQPGPATSPCPSPAVGASPVASAASSLAPEASPSAIPAASRSAFLQGEVDCPGDIGSTVTIPAGATVEEILALGIGGVELQVVSAPLTNLDPSSRFYRQLERALRRQDKSISDVVQHIGAAEADGVLVGAFQVPGADATPLVDSAIAWLLEGFPSRRHEQEAGQVGGKDVTIVRPARAQGRVIYFYPSADAVWFVMAPDDYAAGFLAALP